MPQGGYRNNSGRNKVADKKQQVYVGIRESVIKKLGLKRIQEEMIKAIDKIK